MTIRRVLTGLLFFFISAFVLFLGSTGMAYSSLPSAWSGGPFADAFTATAWILGLILAIVSVFAAIASIVFAVIHSEDF